MLSIPHVGKLLSSALLTNEFTATITALSQDECRWVRMCLSELLGPIVLLFKEAGLPPVLVDLFIGVATKAATVAGIADQDGAMLGAYSFPALLSVLGPSLWEQKLKVVYLNLTKDFQYKVRRTLAFSLHEIARMVGPEIAETDLVPVFDRFLSDTPEVKVGVVQNIGAFLQVLPAKMRKKYLHLLQDLYAEKDDWRSRLSITQQLSSLASFLSPALLLTMTLASCQDPVAEIRSCAAAQIGSTYQTLKDQHPEKAAEILAELLKLATGKNTHRQTFARACLSMFTYLDQATAAPLLPPLLNLLKDSVANVRIWLAIVLLSPPLQPPFYPEFREQITLAIETLRVDKDLQVRKCALQAIP